MEQTIGQPIVAIGLEAFAMAYKMVTIAFSSNGQDEESSTARSKENGDLDLVLEKRVYHHCQIHSRKHLKQTRNQITCYSSWDYFQLGST